MGQQLATQGANGAPQGAQQGSGLSMLTAMPNLIKAFSGLNTKTQSGITGQSADAAGAMMNPQNPLYQNLYGQFNRQNKANAAGAIAAADSQNRLNSATGRTPLFDPSRNGQQSFRQAVLGAQNAGQVANQQTQEALSGANRSLTGFGGTIGAANSATGLRYGQGMTGLGQGGMQTQGYNSLAQLLRGY